MSKSYLSEPKRFTRNQKISAEVQFQRNLDDFHRWVESDISSYEHERLTAEKVIDKIQDTLERYRKEQDLLLDEILEETKKTDKHARKSAD